MGVFLFVLFVLAVIGCYVWQFIESRFALATTPVLTQYTPEQAAQIIDESFGGARGVMWPRTNGRGQINRRRRGYRQGITLSFDIEPLPDGTTRVDMWVSQYVSILLLANFGGAAARRKRAIGRLLAEPDSGQPAVQAEGIQAEAQDTQQLSQQ